MPAVDAFNVSAFAEATAGVPDLARQKVVMWLLATASTTPAAEHI